MPTSPLPNFAGGRPLPDDANALGASAKTIAPPPTIAPPARPAFLRKPRRVSPETSAAASRSAPSTSTSFRLISYVIDVAPFGCQVHGARRCPLAIPLNALYGAAAHPHHR